MIQNECQWTHKKVILDDDDTRGGYVVANFVHQCMTNNRRERETSHVPWRHGPSQASKKNIFNESKRSLRRLYSFRFFFIKRGVSCIGKLLLVSLEWPSHVFFFFFSFTASKSNMKFDSNKHLGTELLSNVMPSCIRKFKQENHQICVGYYFDTPIDWTYFFFRYCQITGRLKP